MHYANDTHTWETWLIPADEHHPATEGRTCRACDSTEILDKRAGTEKSPAS